MKKKTGKILLTVLCALLLLSLLAAVIFASSKGRGAFDRTPTVAYTPNNTYSMTVTAMADEAYDPYSFYTPSGEMSGFDVELFNILADQMGMNPEMELYDWQDVVYKIKAGHQADLVFGVEQSLQMEQTMDLSLPLQSDPYVAFGRASITHPGQLYDCKLAARGSCI